MGKSTISMAIFNSYVTNYQRVNMLPTCCQKFEDEYHPYLKIGGKRQGFATISPGNPIDGGMVIPCFHH